MAIFNNVKFQLISWVWPGDKPTLQLHVLLVLACALVNELDVFVLYLCRSIIILIIMKSYSVCMNETEKQEESVGHIEEKWYSSWTSSVDRIKQLYS